LGVLAVVLIIPAVLVTDSWWALLSAMVGVLVGAIGAVKLVRSERRSDNAIPD
jgi:hypothetical protein